MEPFYIAQNSELKSGEDVESWFRACAQEAKDQGATLCRFSKHPDMDLWLVECWNQPRKEILDQGPIRWQFTHD